MERPWKHIRDGEGASDILVGETVSIGKNVTKYAVSHRRRPDSSSTSLWEHQISKCNDSSVLLRGGQLLEEMNDYHDFMKGSVTWSYF